MYEVDYVWSIMTFAPQPLLDARAYLKGRDADLDNNEVGIVGGPSHIAAGTSYHLGADQLDMSKNPYSARTARDKAGLADPQIRNAACALDVDDDLNELRDMSSWIVQECRTGAADTLDIREVIWSPEGLTVWTWDREQGQGSAPQRRGDSSHLAHTHFSFYRDATRRDKTSIFRRYFDTHQGVNVMGDIPFNTDCEACIKGTALMWDTINTSSGVLEVQITKHLKAQLQGIQELLARSPVELTQEQLEAITASLAALVPTEDQFRQMMREEIAKTTLS